jgi:radical SAM superfamily enzyme YgiQ (UPF0313 family)
VVHNPLVKTYATFPNGLLYRAAVLEEHGHEVRIYDSNIDHRQPGDFISFKPDIIGFSVLTGPNMDAAITQSREFKDIMPGAKIVWGNVHPSILPEQTLAEPYIDYVVIGAGEYTLLELIEHLEKGDKLGDIKGLAYKEKGRIIINEPRPFIKDLDELPDPAWHLVDVGKYWSVTLNTSRGCPFNCTFCYNTAFHRKYRGDLSAERVIAQIKHLRKRYSIKFIRFFEDNFTFNRKRLRRFCQLLIDQKLKIEWDCDSRADLDEEDIALMARSGCVSVALGVESGSPRMLKFLKKDTSVSEMEKTFWLFVKNKIIPRINIMVGLPTETSEDFRLSQDLLERLDNPPYLYNRYVPYPGTTLFDYCIANGLIASPQKLADWPNFTEMSATTVNLSHIPQEKIDQAMADFRKTYALRRIRFMIRHNPTYFWKAIREPLGFYRELKNLIKYYLMMSSNTSDGSKDQIHRRLQKTGRGHSDGQDGSETYPHIKTGT